METNFSEKTGSFEERLSRLLKRLESEKQALNKILRSMESDNDKKSSIKKTE
jgi:hypothetical protein